MKRNLLAVSSLYVIGTVAMGLSMVSVCDAKEYTIDTTHSNVGFVIRHLVSRVNGAFSDYEGQISFDEKKPETSKVTAKVQVKSIDTNQAKRDEHLRSDDFFAEKKYPTLEFVSNKVTPDGNKKYKVAGNLTMRGVTKPVVFDVEYLGEMNDPQMGHRIGLTATAQINRKDFGINWNKVLDNGGIVLGEDVTINLNIEAGEKK